MIYRSREVQIEYRNEQGNHNLYFIFRDRFTKEASIKACSFWRDEFLRLEGEKFHLIWDCRDMTGFEFDAKNIWIENMSELSSRISEVKLISDNVLIRGAARLMFKLFPFQTKIMKPSEEVILGSNYGLSNSMVP